MKTAGSSPAAPLQSFRFLLSRRPCSRIALARTYQAFLLERPLDVVPHLRTRITHRQQQLGLLRDVAEIAHQRATVVALLQVRMLIDLAGIDQRRQQFMEFRAGHGYLLLLIRLVAAFSALLCFSRSRNFMRALCNCDLLLPIEQPIISAISLCSYPSMSCRTNMM